MLFCVFVFSTPNRIRCIIEFIFLTKKNTHTHTTRSQYNIIIVVFYIERPIFKWIKDFHHFQTFCVHCNFVAHKHTPTLLYRSVDLSMTIVDFHQSPTCARACLCVCAIALLIVFRTMFVAWFSINILDFSICSNNTINWPANKKKFLTIQYYYEKRGNNKIFIVWLLLLLFLKIVCLPPTLCVSILAGWNCQQRFCYRLVCPFIFHRRALLKRYPVWCWELCVRYALHRFVLCMQICVCLYVC